MSRFIKELCSQLGVERNPSTAYHPQTDSQMEILIVFQGPFGILLGWRLFLLDC